MSPAEVRRKNMVEPDQFPYRERARLDLRHRQTTSRRSTARSKWLVSRRSPSMKTDAQARGKRLGIGIGSYVRDRRRRTIAAHGPRRANRQHVGDRGVSACTRPET